MALPRCATNFPIWSAARSGRIRRSSRTRPFAPPSRRRPRVARSPAYRRRQIVRRAHDLASPGHRAAPGRPRARVPRISAASGRQAIERARRSSLCRAYPDAVPARNPRQLAALELTRAAVRRARRAARLQLFADADHSFHVPARSGRTDADVREVVLDALSAWIAARDQRPIASAMSPSRPTTTRHHTNSENPWRET